MKRIAILTAVLAVAACTGREDDGYNTEGRTDGRATESPMVRDTMGTGARGTTGGAMGTGILRDTMGTTMRDTTLGTRGMMTQQQRDSIRRDSLHRDSLRRDSLKRDTSTTRGQEESVS